MKSAEAVGPSKNASQDWSAGPMRRLRPSLVISTWRTFGGKVMDFGKRTAWLRLVVNTVERVTLLLHFSTPGISHWDIRNRPAFVNTDSASGKAGQLDRAAPATNGVTSIGPTRGSRPSGFLRLPFAQAHPWPTAVLLDELHAGGFQGATNSQIVNCCHRSVAFGELGTSNRAQAYR